MILDRKTPPQRYPSASIPSMNYNPVQLAGGLACYRVEGGTEDIVKIDLVFKAGTRFEEKPLAASICVNMLREGTENYTSEEISEVVDFYGAQIAPNLSKDRTEVTMLCQGKHLKNLIDIFTDVFMAPNFPQDKLELYKKRSRSALAVNLDKVDFRCRLLFSKLMFGGSDYQDRFELDDYDDIKVSDLKKFFDDRFNLNEAYCVISGKNTIGASELLSDAIAKKAAYKKAFPSEIEPIEWVYKRGESREKKNGAVQTAIRMGAPALFRTHMDYPALYIANVALGGYFGSRLMQNIREEKGYTYGIGSGINVLEKASYLSISTQVGANFTQATIDEINKELLSISSKPLHADEFELIQYYVAGNLLNRFDGPFATADRLKTIVSNNLPASWYIDFTKEIFNLSTEEVLRVAGKYLRPELFTLAVFGEFDE